MANTQVLQRRIRSVKNTRQITKAMEMVAASKLRRMGQAVEHSRSYNDITASIVRRLANNQEVKYHPYFTPAKTKNKLYVVFTSDRGLVGALNTNVLNEALRSFTADQQTGTRSSVIVIGRKGARFFARLKDLNILGEYEGITDQPDLNDFASLLDTIDKGLREGKESPPDNKVYELEPSVEAVLDKALRLYIESQLVHARVETAVSEYAMQMMAMSNASRNAGDLIDNLTLELNATRQAAITQEIAEITGGAAAIAT
jgi:F-type H+-transporting ATPase subunit gamma